MAKTQLLTNQDGNANSDWEVSTGGVMKVTAFGPTFGGGTLSLQTSPDDGTTAIDDDTATFTEQSAAVLVTLPPGTMYRASFSGSSGSTDVSMTVEE